LSAMGAGREADDMLAILRSPPATDALERILTNPGYNSVLHTTCVATMLDAGHAPNALPQNASANVNCRIFPGHTQEEILQILEQLVDDPEVVVSLADAPELTSPPPVLTPKILGPIEMLSEQMWPGVPVIPTMIAGATDGRFFTPRGIPTYGVNGIFRMAGSSNIHGLNEKMRITSLFEGREFLERLIKIYAE
jgi:acetylornithine deacetylase/succinyl-diaminopimelate desuccinylase-like protein